MHDKSLQILFSNFMNRILTKLIRVLHNLHSTLMFAQTAKIPIINSSI